MSSTKKLLMRFLPKGRTKINEPLALHTYIKLGGPADVFTVVRNADELATVVITAEKFRIPWFILGGGSNILVGDLGFRGLVIKNEAEGIWLGGSGNDGVILTAETGVLMSKLAAFANEKGLAGLEVFMSVPGTLGGAIFNNSHYRPEKNEFIGNLVEEAEIMVFDEPRRHFFDTLGSGSSLTASSPPGQSKSKVLHGSSSIVPASPAGGSKMPSSAHRTVWMNRKTVAGSWFRFGYDYSRLQDEPGVVLRVKFQLQRESPERLRNRSLALMTDRNSRQPIGKPSCGCMFKNHDGISAGKLIDEAGLKGTSVGGIRVSQTHANFMENDGTGKVDDVLELMNLVKTRVKEFHGIELEPEIFFVGEFGKVGRHRLDRLKSDNR